MTEIRMKLTGKEYQLRMVSDWSGIGWKRWKQIAPYAYLDQPCHPEAVRFLIEQRTLGIWHPITPTLWKSIPTQIMEHIQKAADFLFQPCTTPVFDSVRLSGRVFYLPVSRLENISVIEFAFLDLAYQLIRMMQEKGMKDQAAEWLDRFCAYMARPIDRSINPDDARTYTGDRRERFNTEIINRRLKLFARMDYRAKFAMLLFFAGCKTYITKRYAGSGLFVDLDKYPIGIEIEGVSKDPKPKQYLELISRLAGGKFGTLEQTRQALLYDVLEELSLQKRMSKQ